MADLGTWASWERTVRDGPFIKVSAVLGRAPGGGSGALLCRLSNGDKAYVKPLTSPQGPRVCLNEFVISAMGQLIGAPVCVVRLVEIAADLAGDYYGTAVAAGIASASLEVPGVLEGRDFVHRSEDDNQRRHAGVVALVDWCWGADNQWLYQGSDDNRIWSHDHGHYFPGGPAWTVDGLLNVVATANQPLGDLTNCSQAEVSRLATALRDLKAEDIQGILEWIPGDWPVTDAELTHLGWFLDLRRDDVADRLEEAMKTGPA